MLTESDTILLIGRILLGGAFLIAGLRNVLNIAPLRQAMTARGVPLARFLLPSGIALQIAAGALLVAGIWIPAAATALILFLLVATPIFHNFWDHQGLDRVNRINGIIANVALAGGFLSLMANAA